MQTQTLLQASLAGGEVSPSFYGRVDLSTYAHSLKTCRGFIVQPSGGLKNRSGTHYIAPSKIASRYARLLPFVYSSLQTFVLEMGHNYMRVFTQGGQMILQPATIAATTAYAGGTTYALGDLCTYSGVYYYSKQDGNVGHQPDISSTYWLALTTSGSNVLVEIPTPWSESDLALLKFTQSADVMTVCHPNYPPYNIARVAADRWTCKLATIELGPFSDVNEDTTQTVYASAVSGTITITSNAAIFKATDVDRLFYIEQQNAGKAWVSNTAMSLNEIRRAYGNYYSADAAGTTGYDPPLNDANKWNDGGVSWTFLHPGFGIAKITAVAGDLKSCTATVISRIPDAHIGSGNTSYKWAKGAWCSENGYPSCTTYHQQRQVFAGSLADPQTIWLSKTGDFSNYGKSAVLKDSDALVYPLDGRMVSSIKHVMTMGADLIAFSSDSEWSVAAPNEGALTPTDVLAKFQGFRGCSDLAPIVIGDMALFVQNKGQIVRDLGYDYLKNVFTGVDLTRYAMHLVENHMIVDWAYQQNPFSTVWCVRDDGVLLSLTYVKDQEVMGWAWHDTDGYVESICCVSEGQEDAVYLIVNRVINGSEVRYVERMANRQLTSDVMSACFLDCALGFDGTNYSATTVTVTDATNQWNENSVVTLTSSTNIFNASTDIGDEMVLDPESGRYNIRITQVVSPTVALGVPQKVVGAGYQGVATTDWGWARGNFSGASVLAGKTIGVYAEGYVQAPTAVALDGTFTISSPAVRIIVGLPYLSDVETLDLSMPGGPPLQDKMKNIPQVIVQLESSRGLKVGGSFDSLVEMKQTPFYNKPIDGFTGPAAINIYPTWSSGGHVCLRQDYPLPLSIQAIVPQVQFAQR